MILQSGIKEIVYFRYNQLKTLYTLLGHYDKPLHNQDILLYFFFDLLYSDKHSEKPSMIASRRMLSMAGVSVRQFVPLGKLTIDFDVINRS